MEVLAVFAATKGQANRFASVTATEDEGNYLYNFEPFEFNFVYYIFQHRY